jgi:phospholipid/cholesterol/gamma-HCH transport system substrate-binding protein
MSTRTSSGNMAGFRAAVAIVAVLLIASALVTFWPSHNVVRITAHFPRTVAVFHGSEVRMLGVPIGKVTKITTEGTTVRVDMEYDARRKVPADAKAVIVSPSVVADRYVQLTPAYTGGPVMHSGADIPVNRTATPVELDRVFDSLDRLSVALGPKGANANGSLSRLLQVGADNLSGQGTQLHQTVADLSQAATTLANGRQDLFATVKNLQTFTTALASSDAQVRAFNADLATVSGQLAGERQELAAALRNLAIALAQVSSFVHDNSAALTSDLQGLSSVSGVLVRQRKALEEFLDVAPTTLSNMDLSYNPRSGTLDTRDNLGQLTDPATYLCSLLRSIGQPQSACTALKGALNLVPKIPTESQPPIGVPDLTLGGILSGKGLPKALGGTR